MIQNNIAGKFMCDNSSQKSEIVQYIYEDYRRFDHSTQLLIFNMEDTCMAFVMHAFELNIGCSR
jgi:hypothetical protein